MLARLNLRNRSLLIASLAGTLLALMSAAAVLADTVPYAH